jgi:hypothetical protein
VGGPYDNSNIGAVWIFSRNGTVWTQQGNKQVGTGAVGSGAQGVSVALSADGNTAIVGGTHDNLSTGAAWIYSRNGGIWTQQGSKLVGTGAAGIAYEGSSVALSADGLPAGTCITPRTSPKRPEPGSPASARTGSNLLSLPSTAPGSIASRASFPNSPAPCCPTSASQRGSGGGRRNSMLRAI